MRPMLLTIHNTGMLNLAGAVSTERRNVRQCVGCASVRGMCCLFLTYSASMKALLSSMKALVRLYEGSMKALLRLHEGSIKAL